MMAILTKEPRKQVIDLTGPQGNAFYLLGLASKLCKELKADEQLNEYVHQNTGLVIDSYFSATKIKWILDNVPKAKALREKDALLFGTVDTWLLWNLTKGKFQEQTFERV